MKGNTVNGIFGTERQKGNTILGACEAESWLLRTAYRRYIIVQALLYYSSGIYILVRSIQKQWTIASLSVNDDLRIFQKECQCFV